MVGVLRLTNEFIRGLAVRISSRRNNGLRRIKNTGYPKIGGFLAFILVVLFLLISWIFLTFRITEVPPGINGDEISIGYNAILVARDGWDATGHFFPLFISTMEESDWKQPITFYSTTLAFKLFSPSYVLLRQVSVIFSLVSLTLIFILLYKLTNIKLAAFGSLIFLTIPIIVIQSHLALENIAPVPVITFWLLVMAAYFKNGDVRLLIIAGFALGLSLYSYKGMRLITPVFILLCAFFVIERTIASGKRLVIRSLFALMIGLLPFITLILLIKGQYPGAFFGNERPIPFESYQKFLLPFLSSFDPSFLFIAGDITPYHSTGKHGVFLLATLPLFLLGCFKIISGKDRFQWLTVTTIFLAPILFGLVDSIHRGSRLLAMVPSYVIITSLGFLALLSIQRKAIQRVSISMVILLISVNFGDFINDYWYRYPDRVRGEFTTLAPVAFDKLYYWSQRLSLNPLFSLNFCTKDKEANRFFSEVYFPSKEIGWLGGTLSDKSILLASPNDLPAEMKRQVKEIDIGLQDCGLFVPYDQTIR